MAASPACAGAFNNGAEADGGLKEIAIKEFPEDYRNQINQTVAAFLRYPPAALRDGLEGKALVCVLMTRSGQISDEKLAKATGYYVLDAEALDVFRRIHSMPAMPDSVFPGVTAINFAFPIDYKIAR